MALDLRRELGELLFLEDPPRKSVGRELALAGLTAWQQLAHAHDEALATDTIPDGWTDVS